MNEENILFLTDTHLGVRGGSSIFRELFREYYRDVLFQYIIDNNIKTVIHAGDFFDNRSSITLPDIDYVLNEFVPQFEKTGATMYVIAGNHDVAYKNTNQINSLALLRSPNIVVVDDELFVLETDNKNIVLCPWINTENYEPLMNELKQYANDDHILVGHFEIVGAKMYKHSKVCDHGIQPAALKDFHKVLSGHFHHCSDMGNVTYLGALFHYTWQDYGDWRGFTTYAVNGNTFTQHENDFCLFIEVDFSELQKNDTFSEAENMETLFSGRYVRLYLNGDYSRVELKQAIAEIEKYNPLSLDVVDLNLSKLDFSAQHTTTDDEDEPNTKSFDEYVEEFVGSMDNKEQVLELFALIKAEAEKQMVENS